MMDSPLIIGFGNKARQGKDFCVQAIIDGRGDKYDIRRMSFAEELKREAAQLNIFEWCLRQGIPYDSNPPTDDPFCPAPHYKQSRFLQWYGTEYRRKQDPNYWVKRLAERVKTEKAQVILIPDMRFKNEFFWVRSMGGFTVKVTRRGYVDLSRSATHPSECDLDNVICDVHIERGDGELDGLREDALNAFDIIVGWVTPQIEDFHVPEAESGSAELSGR